MKRSSPIVWLLRVMELAMFAGAAIAIALFIGLHTAAGMKWLADRVALATQGQIEIAGMTGWLPNRIRAESITIRDRKQNPWLMAKGVEVNVRLRSLRDGVLEIQPLSIRDVHWSQRPEYPRQHQEASQKDIHLAGIKQIQVGEFALHHFLIASNILGHRIEGQLRASATWKTAGAYSATLDGETIIRDQLRHKWQLALNGSGQAIELTRLTLHTAEPKGDRLEFVGTYVLTNATLTGAGRIAVTDLSSYRDLHHLNLSGDISIDFQVAHSGQELPWQFSLRGEAAHVCYEAFAAEHLHLDGNLRVSPDAIQYEAEATASSWQYLDWSLTYPRVISRANISRGSNAVASSYHFDVHTRGRYAEATDFMASGTSSLLIESASSNLHVEVSTLYANWNDAELVILTPARASFASGQATITAPSFLIDQLSGKASARLVNGALDQVDIAFDGDNLSSLLNKLGIPLPWINGRVAGAIHAETLQSHPAGTASLRLDDVQFDHENLHLNEPAKLAMDVALQPDLLTVRSSLLHPMVNHFSGWAEVPIQFGGGWLPITWSDQKDYRAYLQLSADLNEATGAPVNGASMRGQVGLEFDLCGRGSAPTYHGHVFWENGQYRDAGLGMFLDQIQCRVEADQHHWKLIEASARDGGSGTIAADGRLHFDDHREPHWSISLQLKKATLFRIVRTELPLTGNITATGSAAQSRVEGDLWLEPFRFNIPRRLPPSVRALEVTEINHPDPARNTAIVTESAKARPPPSSRATDLDIRVRTRRSFEVIGRGLQSEWRGKMRLTGNHHTPNLSGSAEVVRGYAMLLGRRFNLDEGRLEFTGAIPPNPQLNIKASAQVADTVARLIVSGSVKQPDVRLQSDPMLPENEIMALILFGRTAETMSPWQAIALANGLRILGGGGGDVVNFMEASQSLLRVDQIDIKQDEEGEGFSALTVGKYVGRRLYLEGEKGFGNAENVFTATLELSPRLVLETETSPRIREGISIYWRRDY